MRQSRFTEARIIAILREQEAGSKTGDVCRKNGVGPPALFFLLLPLVANQFWLIGETISRELWESLSAALLGCASVAPRPISLAAWNSKGIIALL